MVVRYLNVVGMPIAPRKANAPLVIDADTALAGTVTRQFLQVVRGGHTQV